MILFSEQRERRFTCSRKRERKMPAYQVVIVESVRRTFNLRSDCELDVSEPDAVLEAMNMAAGVSLKCLDEELQPSQVAIVTNLSEEDEH